MVAFGALVIEAFTLQRELSLKETRTIVFADAAYGLSATVVLITGVLRVLYFGKGTEYYLHNPVFYIKIALFVIIGTLSLYPTFSFLRWIKPLQESKPPELEALMVDRLRAIVIIELVGFSLIPLFAAMMARGIGL